MRFQHLLGLHAVTGSQIQHGNLQVCGLQGRVGLGSLHVLHECTSGTFCYMYRHCGTSCKLANQS